MKHLFNVRLYNGEIAIYTAANLRQLYFKVSDFSDLMDQNYDEIVLKYNAEHERELEHMKSQFRLQSGVSNKIVNDVTKPIIVKMLLLADCHRQLGYSGKDAYANMFEELYVRHKRHDYVSIHLAQLFLDGKDAYTIGDLVTATINKTPIDIGAYAGTTKVWFIPGNKQFYISESDYNKGMVGTLPLPDKFELDMQVRIAENIACYYRYDGLKNPANSVISELTHICRVDGSWQRFISVELLKVFTFDWQNVAGVSSFVKDIQKFVISEIPKLTLINVDSHNNFAGITEFKNFLRLRLNGRQFIAIKGNDDINVVVNDDNGNLTHHTATCKSWSSFTKDAAYCLLRSITGEKSTINWDKSYGPVDSIVSTTGTVKFANATDVVDKMTPEQVINTLSRH
ncbi:hypothetical protein MA9V1_114 [Chryseobacterium phage MA9V-1]|nr:hypothetical protein MA9V1_114 [Chryseobacterium phage MA9V-1]